MRDSVVFAVVPALAPLKGQEKKITLTFQSYVILDAQEQWPGLA